MGWSGKKFRKSKLESGDIVEEDHDGQKGFASVLLPRGRLRLVHSDCFPLFWLSPDFIQMTVERTRVGLSQGDSISSWFRDWP